MPMSRRRMGTATSAQRVWTIASNCRRSWSQENKGIFYLAFFPSFFRIKKKGTSAILDMRKNTGCRLTHFLFLSLISWYLNFPDMGNNPNTEIGAYFTKKKWKRATLQRHIFHFPYFVKTTERNENYYWIYFGIFWGNMCPYITPWKCIFSRKKTIVGMNKVYTCELALLFGGL